MNNIFYSALLVLLSVVNINSSLAQFNLTVQLIQRSEYLHGFGTLSDTRQNAAAFIGQRIQGLYNNENFKIYISAQDIRTFGSTAQMKVTDGFFSMHEAWGEVFLMPKFSAKIGRQELDFNDARFLGNVDWALQARAHDFVLLKFTDSTLQIHAGGAYNQEKQNQLSGNFYSISGQYKAAQFFWLNKQFGKIGLSAIFWNNGMQYLQINSDSSRKESIKSMQTFGLPKVEYKSGGFTATTFFYQQTGKDVSDKNVNAYDALADASFLIKINDSLKNSLRISAGAELLSGTSQIDTANKTNNSYNPLYGTNHKHNGYMDYFYVGGRHINSIGLQDMYLKFKYDFNPKVFVSLNSHWFSATADVRDKTVKTELKKMDRNLGYETDFTLGLVLNNAVSLQAGYSQFFATKTLENLRGGSADRTNNWA